MPKFTTFAATTHEIEIAIESGIDHLILEDSKVSARSYSNDFQNPTFEKIGYLAHFARSKKPNIGLSVNIDVMAHDYHLPTITDAVEASRYAGIDEFRVQDPGLALLIKTIHPNSSLTLATETGNNNSESHRAFSRWFARQTFGNELTHAEIASMAGGDAESFDIQVHGPILIQYSYRRYLSGYKISRGETTRRLAQDLEYPGRYFPFYENPHGHFMYLYFDRCLIKYIHLLGPLNIGRWIIDARGESFEYLKTAIKTYKNAAIAYLSSPSNYSFFPEWVHDLETVGRRALKAGFFLANKTDSEHRMALKVLQDTSEYVGTIIDVVRGKWITIELERSISVPAPVTLYSPEGPKVSFKIESLFTLADEPLQHSQQYRYVKTRWQKGAVPKSVILSEEASN